MNGASWPAPAKLNLFLHIVGRRDDGYHMLQTAFLFLDYRDELEFSPRSDGELALSGNYQGIPPENDLIVKAARLLQHESGTGAGADIHIRKSIPMGGGLGGGSSNAATTLVALNCLWKLGLSTDNLSDIALRLGADVPVFVRGSAAWAEGVGECLTPISHRERWYLVVSPGVHVSTAEIFNAPDLTRNTAPITIRDFLGGAGKNDCEPVVRSRYPEVAHLIDWMGEKAPSKMTGTGACVYGEFDSEDAARRVHGELPKEWEGFVARGMNRSPLLDRLREQQSD